MRSDLYGTLGGDTLGSRNVFTGERADAQEPMKDVVVAIERDASNVPHSVNIWTHGRTKRDLRAVLESEMERFNVPDIAPEGEVTRVNLSLSRDAAIFLRSLMGHVAGPSRGSRRFADEILRKMEEAWGGEMPRYDHTHARSENDGRKMVVGLLDMPERPRLIKGYGADQHEVTK